MKPNWALNVLDQNHIWSPIVKLKEINDLFVKVLVYHLDGHVYEFEYNPKSDINFKWQEME